MQHLKEIAQTECPFQVLFLLEKWTETKLFSTIYTSDYKNGPI